MLNTVTQLLRSYGELLLVALVGVPVSVIVWWFLAQWRGDRWRSAGDVAIVVTLLPVVYLVLVPTYGAPSQVSLVPGADLASAFEQVQKGSLSGLMQVVVNIALLAPLGAVVPLRVRPMRSLSRVVVAACVLAVSVEAAQYLLDNGRITSTDDVLLNTLGAALGAMCTRAWWTHAGRPSSDATPEALRHG